MTGDQGSVELRNPYTGPTIGAPVSVEISGGWGSASPDTGVTDATGAWQTDVHFESLPRRGSF